MRAGRSVRSNSSPRRRISRMAVSRDLFGLSAEAKARLLEKLSSAATRIAPADRPAPQDEPGADTGRLDVSRLEACRDIRIIEEAAAYLSIGNPFFRVHQGIAGTET